MTAQEPPQFTPAQVLAAGQRAEAEGRAELAVKFYRHLCDHYIGTPEAAEAHGALARLAEPVPAMAPPHMNGQRPAPAARPATGLEAPREVMRMDPALGSPVQPMSASPVHANAHAHVHAQAAPQPGLGNPFEARGPEPGFGQWQPQPAHPLPAPNGAAMPQSPADEAYDAPQVDLPLPARDYRTGRAMARLMTWLGGFQAVIGLVLVPITFLSPRALSGVPLLGALLGGPAAGMSVLLAGLVQILVGQVVRALLDHANAARDLAAITRAEAEARYGIPEPPRRRRRRG